MGCMAEQPAVFDPRATFNASLYADTYKFARATLRLAHDQAVAHAYNIAASAPKPDRRTPRHTGLPSAQQIIDADRDARAD